MAKAVAKAEPAAGTIHVVKRLEASCNTPGCYATVYAYADDDEQPRGPWFHNDTGRTTCVVRTERRGRHAASETIPRT